MISFFRHVAKILILSFIGSCTVTNNLYVVNPKPIGKRNGLAYIGIGTGVQPKIDSVNNNSGDIKFSNKISTAPILSLGGQFGISNQTDLRFALHLPKIIGGGGIRLGIQHSLLDSNAKSNIAFGLDMGGVFSKDSIKIFGLKTPVNKETNGAINADIFIPVSLKLKHDYLLVITPRYSFNTFYIRKNQNNNEDQNFNLGYPALSMGVWSKKFYFETSAIFYNEKVYPHFGFARLLDF